MLGLEIIWSWGWISFKLYRYLFFRAIYCNRICFAIHLKLKTIIKYLFVVIVCAKYLMFALANPLSLVFIMVWELPCHLAFLLGLASGDPWQRSEREKSHIGVSVPLASCVPHCLVLALSLDKACCFSPSDHFWKSLFQVLVTVVSSCSHLLCFFLHSTHIFIM